MPSRAETEQSIQTLIRQLDQEQDLLREKIGRRSTDTPRGLLVRQALLDEALRWLYLARLEGADAAAEEDVRAALRLMAEALEGDGR